MKSPMFCCVMIVLLSLGPTLARADLREWTSDDGKFKVRAELTGFDGGMARLKKPDGTEINVPVARLSAADRTFVEAWKKDVVELPAAVVKFQTSLKSLREHEGKRLEQRIESIKLDIAKGKVAKPPVGAKVVIDAPGLEKAFKKATEAVGRLSERKRRHKRKRSSRKQRPW